jgi:formylglycine-generating enzyme required for sulfatase activity
MNAMPRFFWFNAAIFVALLACERICSTCHAEQYLFLVGVKDYSQKGELTDLKYAEEDVHTLAQLFSEAGVPSTNIVLMTQRVAANKARFAPSAEQIRNELDLLLKILKPEDSIIVGFSGHGLQFKNDDTNYYCPIDAKPDTDNKDTLVSLTDVYLKLEQCKANTKLLLVDACRNDPLSSTAKAARRIEIEPVFSRPAPVFNGGTIAIFSCSESEQSFEHPDLKSGLFFHFVNRALAGEADADDDNVVDLGELENFATKNVQKWAQTKLGKSQTPESRGTKRGTIELVRFDRKVVPKFPPLETMTEMDRNSPSIPLPKLKATGKTLTNSIGMKLTLIPKGTFLMGAPPDEEDSGDDELQHVVTISKDFYLGMYEVTQAEYQKVMGTNPSKFQGDKIAERHPKTGRVVKKVDSANYPVENVTWFNAVEFCKKLSELPEERAAGRVYRLPTEAEWEHACRAGSTTSYTFGDDREELGEYAWLRSNAGRRTHPVVEKKPNAWGLYDMHGNVWEWCSDWYGSYHDVPTIDPLGPSTGSRRVLRGGSWDDEAADCRSAERSRFSPSFTIDRDYGFRVALSSSGIPK